MGKHNPQTFRSIMAEVESRIGDQRKLKAVDMALGELNWDQLRRLMTDFDCKITELTERVGRQLNIKS